VLQPWTCHCGQTNAGPAPCSACLNAAPPGIAALAPEPARDDRSALRRVLALVTAVLLVAGALGAAFFDGDGDGDDDDRPQVSVGGLAAEGRTVELSPDSRPGPAASDLERAVPDLMRFVQEARGLPFKAPVEVTLLPDKAFRERLTEEDDGDKAEAEEELETTQRVLEALGLLERGIDLEAAVESLYGDAVAGFYDPEEDDLVVRGEELTVGVRTTLVHELVHALQDQHFDIDRPELDDRDDEASTGFTGLVEGDAVRVERLYLDSLSAAERKRAEQEELAAGAGIDADLPRILLQLVAFPYLYGPVFTTAVFDAEGQVRLDAAYAAPPTTSEQLLHPEAFLAGEGGDEVEPPTTDGGAEVIDEGVIGELVLLLILNESGVSGQQAAEGWGGDRYVAWRDGDETCVRFRVAMDSPQDDAELRRALDRLADEREGVEVEGRGPFTVTSCG
jgi:hypothetical protein